MRLSEQRMTYGKIKGQFRSLFLDKSEEAGLFIRSELISKSCSGYERDDTGEQSVQYWEGSHGLFQCLTDVSACCDSMCLLRLSCGDLAILNVTKITR